MGAQIPLEEGTRFFIENQSFSKILIILDKKLLPELVILPEAVMMVY